ncbi:Interferon-induced 44, partial [Clarias magur]
VPTYRIAVSLTWKSSTVSTEAPEQCGSGLSVCAADHHSGSEMLQSSKIMSDVIRCIKEEVTSVLPSLPEDTLNLLVEKVFNQGVESKEDLQYVKEEDIAELIRPIQCRKLLKAWSAHGPVEETNCWMVSIEGHVVTEGESFLLGLATLFASFYNFNLQYQNEACCTLEFIQSAISVQ